MYLLHYGPNIPNAPIRISSILELIFAMISQKKGISRILIVFFLSVCFLVSVSLLFALGKYKNLLSLLY